MDAARVRATLIQVLEAIQHDSGYAGAPITGSTCPVTDLEGFDSKIWPVAIAQLSKAIGISIPNRNNIFVSADGKQHLTVDQIALGVCSLEPGAA